MDVARLSPHLADAASLRYFATVARMGSFRQAAAKLRIVPSAVSRQISILEEELSAVLFERDRGRNGVKLTPAGEILLRHVESALGELASARREIAALQQLERGRIRLGVNGPFTGILVTRLLMDFHERLPQLEFHVVVGNTPHLVRLLREEEIDIALVNNLRDRDEVRVIVETTATLSVLTPRGHPLASRVALSVSDLADHDLIMPDESLLLKPILEGLFTAAKIVPRTVLTTNSLDFIRDLVEIGFAMAIVSSPDPSDRARPNTVHIPLIDQPAIPGTLACCTLPGRALSPAVNSFTNSLRLALGSAETSALDRDPKASNLSPET